MSEEAFKLPEQSDLEHHSAFQPGNVHPLSKSDTSNNVFGRFVQKVSLIFTKTPQTSELKLNGRIRELQTIADTVLFELLDFKKDIKEKIDPDLFSLVTTILDPLIKEAGREPPSIEKMDNTAKQVKVFSRYVDSIEKAKAWVEIGKTQTTKEALEQALIQQTAKEFLSRIDRDIQVIQDYLSHALSSLEMSEILKNELKESLMPGLSPKMLVLHQLKKLPADFSLSSFIQWRSNADRHREILFGEILHIIDSFSHDFLPSPQKETENAQAKAILNQINSLEERIGKISLEMGNTRQMDENQRKNFQVILERLEAEVHQLNTNLHLSPEHGEIIESFLETLLSLREDLSY